MNQNIDEKTDALCQELKASCENLKEEVPQQAAIYLREKVSPTQAVKGVLERLTEIWENIKQTKAIKGGKAKREMLAYIVKPKYSNAVKTYLNQLQSAIEDNAHTTSEYVKEALCKVVNESSFVNPSDRDKLAHVILRYPHITVPSTIELDETAAISYDFLWFHWEWDEKISKNNMHEFVDTQFRQCCSAYRYDYNAKYNKSLMRWIDALCLEIISNLSDFSPALRDLNDQLQVAMLEQKRMSEEQKALLKNSETIETLLEIEEEY